MNHTTDPVRAAGAYMEAALSKAERRDLMLSFDAAEFQREIMDRAMTETTGIDGLWPTFEGGAEGIRRPRLWEVASQQLDYDAGPQLHEVLAVLVRVAKDGDAQAQSIIHRMAECFAAYKVQE